MNRIQLLMLSQDNLRSCRFEQMPPDASGQTKNCRNSDERSYIVPLNLFTSAVMRALPAGSSALFQVLGASRMSLFRHLVLPAAVPNWMIALRLAAPSAILSAMLAEFLMG